MPITTLLLKRKNLRYIKMKRKEAIFVLVVMILSSITGILVVGANTAVEIDDYGNHYSQRTIQSYSSTYDDCLVGFTVQHQLQTNGVTDDESPFFSPVIEVAINPDFESYESNIFYTGWDSYFIDSVKMKWNLKCPDGSYRPYDKIDEQLQTYKMEGTDNSAYLQQGAEFLYTSMDAAASEYTPAKLAKYLVSVTPSTLNYGHDSINNWIEWEEGYVTSVVNGKIPNNCHDTLSLMADFGAI